MLFDIVQWIWDEITHCKSYNYKFMKHSRTLINHYLCLFLLQDKNVEHKMWTVTAV